jgi:hypothetical protein
LARKNPIRKGYAGTVCTRVAEGGSFPRRVHWGHIDRTAAASSHILPKCWGVPPRDTSARLGRSNGWHGSSRHQFNVHSVRRIRSMCGKESDSEARGTPWA